MFYLLNSVTFFISFLPLILCVSNSTERRNRSDAAHKNEGIFGINITPSPPPPSKIDMYVNDWVRNILQVDGIGLPGDVISNASFPPVSKDHYYVGMQSMIKKYCFNVSSRKACMQVVLKPHVYEEIPLKFRLFRSGTDSDSETEKLGEKNPIKGYGTRKNKKKYNKDDKYYKSRNAFDQFYKYLSKRKNNLQHSLKNSENGSPVKTFIDNSSFGALDGAFMKIRLESKINTVVEMNKNGESVTKPEEEENEIKERIKRAAKSSHKKTSRNKKKKKKATTQAADDDYDESDDEEEFSDEDDNDDEGDEDKEEKYKDKDEKDEEEDYDDDEDEEEDLADDDKKKKAKKDDDEEAEKNDEDGEDDSGEEESEEKEAGDDYVAVGRSKYGKVFVRRSNDSSADDTSEKDLNESDLSEYYAYAHDPSIHKLGAYDVAQEDNGKYLGANVNGVQDWNRCQLPPPRKTSEVLCKVLPTKMVCKLYCIHGYTYPEGISRETVCELRKGAWSKKFEECLPFVDCTLKLKTAGYLKCTTNTVQTGPRCQVECQRYAENEGTGKKTYQCDATGRWDPPLPHCVEREGIDVVNPPPNMSHVYMDYPQ